MISERYAQSVYELLHVFFRIIFTEFIFCRSNLIKRLTPSLFEKSVNSA
jgi:hypothetical protein